MKRQAVILGLLACAFLGRVLGQIAVALFGPDWLPPMQDWYSGLLSYSILLPLQVGILALQARISWDLWRGAGFFSRSYPRFGLGLRWFSFGYFAMMLLRYLLTMAVFPERRWLGSGTIPIVFHWVLAAYLFAWSRTHNPPTGGLHADTT
jgi:hypothetical protein